jgi:phospholipid/cholesterol/gamma-HCH transport system ATP-binding protein
MIVSPAIVIHGIFVASHTSTFYSLLSNFQSDKIIHYFEGCGWCSLLKGRVRESFMIEVKNIQKGFADKTVIEGVSAVMKSGQCNLIIGASGSGKTVLMKCMVGLFEPDAGDVLYSGQSFTTMNSEERTEIRKEIGMLFQGSALFDSLTVEQNVMFPLNMFTKWPAKQKLDRVNEVLARVNLVDTNKKFPAELSGGMKKRVGIARAIVLNPKYLFCDEPNSGLDPQTSLVIDKLIKEITIEFNITTVVNTHDMNSVMEIGNYILYMYKGKKEWEGNNKEIIFSKNRRLNDFIFASEFLRDAKDMRMLEETGKIANERNMDELLDKDAPTLVPPPDEE